MHFLNRILQLTCLTLKFSRKPSGVVSLVLMRIHITIGLLRCIFTARCTLVQSAV